MSAKIIINQAEDCIPPAEPDLSHETHATNIELLC
jgi:hypothetical protein